MVTTALRRAAFLDRDGVILRSTVRAGKPYAPRRLEDCRLLPGARAAIDDLKRAGLLVIVVTNQPDIGNGLVEASVVEQMHARLRRTLAVDDIRMCPHRQDAGCDCRKPRPGMLRDAARAHGIDLARSFMVGDRASDVEAGAAAGCYTVFLDRRYGENAGRDIRADVTVRSLPEAARHLLSRIESRQSTDRMGAPCQTSPR
jgi:D-glycero-D-manno-heptose 1,7-bisphosphate phosphatase